MAFRNSLLNLLNIVHGGKILTTIKNLIGVLFDIKIACHMLMQGIALGIRGSLISSLAIYCCTLVYLPPFV